MKTLAQYFLETSNEVLTTSELVQRGYGFAGHFLENCGDEAYTMCEQLHLDLCEKRKEEIKKRKREIKQLRVDLRRKVAQEKAEQRKRRVAHEALKTFNFWRPRKFWHKRAKTDDHKVCEQLLSLVEKPSISCKLRAFWHRIF